MYGPGPGPGPGYASPQRRTPTHVIVLRVLFAVLPLLSLGLLTGATLVRLAVVTRRARDWWLFGLSAVVTVTCVAFVPEDIETRQADLAVGGLLLNAALFTGYYLFAEIRHFDRDPVGVRPHVTPYSPTYPQVGRGQGYGYPQPQANPYAQPHPHPQPHPQPRPVTQPQPHPGAQPQPQASPRIDRVRAELDELSDLLRKEDDK
ncbi:hypothetical protein [Streptomyces sp. TRM64462]|uniref:hypothetical protein n=1 Tax=Streptomyces sp. TRM64462 TaxID=2741726 RepID=UPI001585F430|nr:hypothetical protein [Streptomyces sp. TRM64462]